MKLFRKLKFCHKNISLFKHKFPVNTEASVTAGKTPQRGKPKTRVETSKQARPEASMGQTNKLAKPSHFDVSLMMEGTISDVRSEVNHNFHRGPGSGTHGPYSHEHSFVPSFTSLFSVFFYSLVIGNDCAARVSCYLSIDTIKKDKPNGRAPLYSLLYELVSLLWFPRDKANYPLLWCRLGQIVTCSYRNYLFFYT